MNYDFAFKYKSRNKDIMCIAVNYVEYSTPNHNSVKVIGDEIKNYRFPLNADYVLQNTEKGIYCTASKDGLILIQVSESDY